MKKKLIELRNFKDRSPDAMFKYLGHYDARNYINESCSLADLWLYEYWLKENKNDAHFVRSIYIDFLILSHPQH